MKQLTFMATLFLCLTISAQQPYSPYKSGRSIFAPDPLNIREGKQDSYFRYAMELYKQDSIRKAGQIFDRLYWFDTTTAQSKQSLAMRIKIEQELARQFLEELYGEYVRNTCTSHKGYNGEPPCADRNKKLEFDAQKVRFYVNDILVRETGYVIRNNFEWFGGSISHFITFADSPKEWFIFLSMPYDKHLFRQMAMEWSNYDRKKPEYITERYTPTVHKTI